MMLHVLVAVDNGTQKECLVTDDDLLAHALFKVLQEIYGGANVAHWHRELNRTPFILARALAARAYGSVSSDGGAGVLL